MARRKKKNDTALIIGAVAAVAVVIVALVAVLIVRGLSSDDKSSGSFSSSESSSVSSSEVQSSSSSEATEEKPEEPLGPAGPLVPGNANLGSDEDEKEEDKSSSSASSESSSAPETSAPSSSSTAPVTTTKAPVTTTAPATTTKPVTTTKAPATTTKPATTTAAASMKQLATPEAEVGADDGDLFVIWEPVANASGYLVQLFDSDDDSTVLEEATLEDSEEVYYFEHEIEKKVTYKIKIQALGTGAYYDSNRRVKTVDGEDVLSSGSSSSSKQIAKPENVEAYLEDGELTLEWDAVKDAVSYTVELIKPSGKVVETDTTDGTGYIFETELTESGTYKVRICANPKKSSGYASSVYVTKSVKGSGTGSSGSSTKLAAPELSVRKFNTYLEISWDPVQYATDYYIEIVEPNGKVQKLGEFYADESPYEYYGDMNKKGTYQIRIKAIDAEEVYKDSSYAIEKITKSTIVLDTPSDAELVSTTSKSATIEWEPVDDASYYQIQVYEDDELISTLKKSPTGVGGNNKTQTLKIEKLSSETEYRVRIRACSNEDDVEDSGWSDYLDFWTD